MEKQENDINQDLDRSMNVLSKSKWGLENMHTQDYYEMEQQQSEMNQKTVKFETEFQRMAQEFKDRLLNDM